MDSKEKSLFREAIKFYENKQYKRGLKNCEQILKKYPEHGETIALKGLFTLYLGKRDEGFEICKSGLKLSLQSHISWHILGLMHRYDKNYEEAIKCYKSALRIDKENFQILRDLALLQLQCRQFDGIIETRKRILLSHPTAPFNWISIVIAYHMSGNLKQALDTLNGYLDLFKNISDPAQDHLYYKVTIMEEMGLYVEAMEFMKRNMRKQSTRRFIETFARLALGAKDFTACQEAAGKLLDINPECREYISLQLECHRAQNLPLLPLFEQVAKKSQLAGVEFLSHLNLEDFLHVAPKLFKNLLTKRSSAVFSLFKHYLNDSDRRHIIWNAASECLEEDGLKEAALIFAANFHSYTGNQEEGLKCVDQLIAIRPMQKDYLLLKAKILKRANRATDAVHILEAETEYFLKDKYSASKVAKYQLRYGSIAAAQEIISSFIQKPTLEEKIDDLHEMQATWYLIEMADRLMHEGMYLDAACFYKKIEMIYDEFIDDQLDFHGFSIRKMSFVDYIKFLRYLDSGVRKSSYLKRSLMGQAKILMAVMEQADLAASLATLSVNDSSADKDLVFVDRVSVIRAKVSTIMSTPNGIEDALKRICHTLLQHNSDSTEALECCLQIAVKLNCKLLAQNIIIKLRSAGHCPTSSVIEAVNSGRSDALWSEIPLI